MQWYLQNTGQVPDPLELAISSCCAKAHWFGVAMAESTQQSKVPMGSSGYSPSSGWAGSAQKKVELNPPCLSPAAAWQSDPLLHFADDRVQAKEALWLGLAGIQGCSDHCMSSASQAGWSPTLEITTWLREECPFEEAI